MATGGLQQSGQPVKKTICMLTHSRTFLFLFLFPAAAVFLCAGGSVRGGGARPEATGALGRDGEAEPAT